MRIRLALAGLALWVGTVMTGAAQSSDSALIAGLGNTSPAVRATSAQQLGEKKVTAAVDSLIAALADDDAAVRHAVVIALGRIGERRAIPPVKVHLVDDPGIARECVTALRALGDSPSDDKVKVAWLLAEERFQEVAAMGPDAIKTLKDAIIVGHQSIRKETAARALGILKVQGADEALNFALVQPDPGLQASAAWAVGELRVVGGIPRLIPLTTNADATVREYACRSLGQLQAREGLDALVRASQDPERTVARAALLSLCAIPTAKGAEVLIRAMRTDGTIEQHVRHSLAATTDPQLVDLLLPLLTDRDTRLREIAADNLGRFKDTRVVDPLIKALKDDAFTVRNFAIDGLSRSDDPRAKAAIASVTRTETAARPAPAPVAPPRAANRPAPKLENVIPLLSHFDEQMRFTALMTLTEIDDPRAYGAVVKLLSDPVKEIRAVAGEVLMKAKSPTVIPYVTPLLTAKESTHRDVAVRTLVNVKGYEARPVVLGALKDPDGNIRSTGVEMLTRLGGPDAADLLIPMLEDKQTPVRDKVYESLIQLTGQDHKLDLRKWSNRPRAYGMSNGPLSIYTVTKFLILMTLVFLVKVDHRPWLNALLYGAAVAVLAWIIRLPDPILLRSAGLSAGLAYIYFALIEWLDGEMLFTVAVIIVGSSLIIA